MLVALLDKGNDIWLSPMLIKRNLKLNYDFFIFYFLESTKWKYDIINWLFRLKLLRKRNKFIEQKKVNKNFAPSSNFFH